MSVKETLMLLWILLLPLCRGMPTNANCYCGLFLNNELRQTRDLAISLANDIKVDCSNMKDAVAKCREYCSSEMITINLLFRQDPNIFRPYPPSQNLPCNLRPKPTVSFAKVCNAETFISSSRGVGPSVCCDSVSGKPIWCALDSALPSHSFTDNIVEGRKLDLTIDKNDESLNEIDHPTTKPTKSKVPATSVTSTSQPWIKTALAFFGYNSLGDFLRSINIFELPGKIQSMVKTYRDEVAMGRCYMEFTTFKVFSKEESPFQDTTTRNKRGTSEDSPRRFDEVDLSSKMNERWSRSRDRDEKMMRNDSVKNILGGVAALLQRSETTKPYSDMIGSLLPLLSHFLSPGDGGATAAGSQSPASMIMNFAAPFLAQMFYARPPANSIGLEEVTYSSSDAVPFDGPSTPPLKGGVSPSLTSLALTMLNNVINNMVNNQVVPNESPESTTTTARPIRPSTAAPSQDHPPPPPPPDFLAVAANTLMKLFLPSAEGPASAAGRPAAQTPRPQPTRKPPTTPVIEKKERKTFIDVLLEFIRPVFISIFGRAPGESGVEDIRRLSSLSTLGRVDDTLKDEVNSPLFCFKKYMVNKAWTLTEGGLRGIVSQFTAEEQARMMKSLIA